MTLSAVHLLVVIHLDELSRPKKWRLQLFGRKKSIMLPDGCHVLDMRGIIPGVTIPSSRSGSHDDRLTKYSPVRMFILCRAGTGTYFRVGLVAASALHRVPILHFLVASGLLHCLYCSILSLLYTI